jgi:hypothetical protein
VDVVVLFGRACAGYTGTDIGGVCSLYLCGRYGIYANRKNRYVFAKFQNGLLKIADVQGGSDVKTIPTYLGLLIFGFLYQLLLVYDALRARNTIQVIGILFMNIAILVYTSIQGDQIEDAYDRLLLKNLIYEEFWPDVKPYLTALPIITAVGSLVLTGIAWKLYEEFAWTIYKQISADVRMKNRFLLYQVRWKQCGIAETTTNSPRVDLHRPPEVRLLPLPRIRHSVPHYCSQHPRCRVLPHSRRSARHSCAPPPRSVEHEAGEFNRHGSHNRKHTNSLPSKTHN